MNSNQNQAGTPPYNFPTGQQQQYQQQYPQPPPPQAPYPFIQSQYPQQQPQYYAQPGVVQQVPGQPFMQNIPQQPPQNYSQHPFVVPNPQIQQYAATPQMQGQGQGQMQQQYIPNSYYQPSGQPQPTPPPSAPHFQQYQPQGYGYPQPQPQPQAYPQAQPYPYPQVQIQGQQGWYGQPAGYFAYQGNPIQQSAAQQVPGQQPQSLNNQNQNQNLDMKNLDKDDFGDFQGGGGAVVEKDDFGDFQGGESFSNTSNTTTTTAPAATSQNLKVQEQSAQVITDRTKPLPQDLFGGLGNDEAQVAAPGQTPTNYETPSAALQNSFSNFGINQAQSNKAATEVHQKIAEPEFVPGQEFKKGSTVLYRQRDGTYVPAKVLQVDLSIVPPAYMIRVDGSERNTEHNRLKPMNEPQQQQDTQSNATLSTYDEAVVATEAVTSDDDFGEFQTDDTNLNLPSGAFQIQSANFQNILPEEKNLKGFFTSNENIVQDVGMKGVQNDDFNDFQFNDGIKTSNSKNQQPFNENNFDAFQSSNVQNNFIDDGRKNELERQYDVDDDFGDFSGNNSSEISPQNLNTQFQDQNFIISETLNNFQDFSSKDGDDKNIFTKIETQSNSNIFNSSLEIQNSKTDDNINKISMEKVESRQTEFIQQINSDISLNTFQLDGNELTLKNFSDSTHDQNLNSKGKQDLDSNFEFTPQQNNSSNQSNVVSQTEQTTIEFDRSAPLSLDIFGMSEQDIEIKQEIKETEIKEKSNSNFEFEDNNLSKINEQQQSSFVENQQNNGSQIKSVNDDSFLDQNQQQFQTTSIQLGTLGNDFNLQQNIVVDSQEINMQKNEKQKGDFDEWGEMQNVPQIQIQNQNLNNDVQFGDDDFGVIQGTQQILSNEKNNEIQLQNNNISSQNGEDVFGTLQSVPQFEIQQQNVPQQQQQQEFVNKDQLFGDDEWGEMQDVPDAQNAHNVPQEPTKTENQFEIQQNFDEWGDMQHVQDLQNAQNVPQLFNKIENQVEIQESFDEWGDMQTVSEPTDKSLTSAKISSPFQAETDEKLPVTSNLNSEIYSNTEKISSAENSYPILQSLNLRFQSNDNQRTSFDSNQAETIQISNAKSSEILNASNDSIINVPESTPNSIQDEDFGDFSGDMNSRTNLIVPQQQQLGSDFTKFDDFSEQNIQSDTFQTPPLRNLNSFELSNGENKAQNLADENAVVGVWISLSHVCEMLMKQACETLEQCRENDVINEFLQSDGGVQYLRSIGMVYQCVLVLSDACTQEKDVESAGKVLERCKLLWASQDCGLDGCVQKCLESQLQGDSQELKLLLRNICKNVYSASGVQDFGGDLSQPRVGLIRGYSGELGVCGLSLQPLASYSNIPAVFYKSKTYLAPLLNLWLNQVSLELPEFIS